jgi:hypothetical protein
MAELSIAPSSTTTRARFAAEDARIAETRTPPAAPARVESTTTPVVRAEVNPFEQAATRRGAAGADAIARRALDARLPDASTPGIDRQIAQSAATAQAAVERSGGARERDQLQTMNGLRARMTEAGGGSLAGYLRNREGAAQTAERALAAAGPNSDVQRLTRARDFAREDLSAARMKVGILESGFGQLEDGQLSDLDKLSMSTQVRILGEQQARVEALR